MSQFKNIAGVPALFFSLLGKLAKQKNYLKKVVLPELDKAKANNDGSLDETDFKKIIHYYGLAVPSILGEAFCALHGKKMSLQERETSTCQGAMTGLFDDFFDKQNLSDEELITFIENPVISSNHNSSEKLFFHFYTSALNNCINKEKMLDRLNAVHLAQVESKKQAKPGLAKDEIMAITLKKGGYSLLFYRTAFDTILSAGEERLLFNLGGLMQLANDIFDVYKDYKAGVQTLMTTAKKVDDVRAVFIEKMQSGYREAYKSGHPTKNVYRFLQIISIGIFSRTLVCLDHLEKSERLTDGVFTPSNYTRKQLICDMDKFGAILASLKYHFRFCTQA